MKTLNAVPLSQRIDKSKEQEIVREIQQGIKDDQYLSPVAQNIKVAAKEGMITLNGTVFTEQQMNLAANTAMAIAMVDTIENNLVIAHKKRI